MLREPFIATPWILVVLATFGSILANQDQYHIQTDEGPERYFRYMTLSGQYRKEKRLEDGTVVGSYGWVDDDGMFRLKDYIADNDGYRIIRTKNIYVGRKTPVRVALKTAKTAPASSGYVPNIKKYNSAVTPNSIDYQPLSATTSYLPPSTHYKSSSPDYSALYSPPSTTYLPSFPNEVDSQIGSSSITNTNIQPAPDSIKYQTNDLHRINYFNSVSKTPDVQILPNSGPTPPSVSPLVPSSTIEPPILVLGSSTVTPTSIPTTTGSPIQFSSSTTSTTTISSSQNTTQISPLLIATETSRSFTQNNETFVQYTSTPPPIYLSTTLSPPTAYETSPNVVSPAIRNEIETNDYSSHPQYEHYDERSENPYIHSNGPTYPIDQNGRIFTGRISNENRNSRPINVPITNDGFRYYLPKAYHEEQSLPDDTKMGSFGYVDPFGIERVVYYKADPSSGFLHKKRNRYLGVHATPYNSQNPS